MDSLLGNYISTGDLIVVHLCGQQRTHSIRKVQEYLGLTITDNGIGRAFVKRVNSTDSVVLDSIKPGDHIAMIDSESTVGKRHYEVARAIREIPCEKTFTITLIQSICATLPPANSILKTSASRIDDIQTRDAKTYTNQAKQIYSFESDCDELINSSLPLDRLLSKSNNLDDSAASAPSAEYRRTISLLNTTLESLLGISDNLLAIRIYRLAKENATSYENFVQGIRNSELSVFNFGDDIEQALWNRVTKTDYNTQPNLEIPKSLV